MDANNEPIWEDDPDYVAPQVGVQAQAQQALAAATTLTVFTEDQVNDLLTRALADQQDRMDKSLQSLSLSSGKPALPPLTSSSIPLRSKVGKIGTVDVNDMLIQSYLDPVQYFDDIGNKGPIASAIYTGTDPNSPVIGYNTDDKLEKLLVEQSVAIKHLLDGTPEGKNKVGEWLKNNSVQSTRDALNEHDNKMLSNAKRISAISSYSKSQTKESNFVACPPLGDRSLDGKVRRDFKSAMAGIMITGSGDDVNLPFATCIQCIVTHIIDYRLDRNACYNLCRAVTKDEALMKLNSFDNMGVAFHSYFRSLQSSFALYFSPTAIHAAIDKVKNAPPYELNKAFAQLADLNEKLFSGLPPVEKLRSITTALRADLEYLVKLHYPHLFAIIKNQESDMMHTYNLEREAVERAGLPLTSMVTDWHPIVTLEGIIIEKTNGITPVTAKEGRRTHVTSIVAGPTGKKSGNRNQSSDSRNDNASRVPDRGRQRDRSKIDAGVNSMYVNTGGYRRGGKRPAQRAQGYVNYATSGPRGNRNSTSGWRKQSYSSRPNRTPSRGPNGRFRSSSRPRMRSSSRPGYRKQATVNSISQGDGNAAQGQAAFRCNNCNLPYHRWAECRIYNKAKPGNKVCANCGGKHASYCKRDKKANIGAQSAERDKDRSQ
jgi:hypothetical protein